jgi:hypothetical protein
MKILVIDHHVLIRESLRSVLHEVGMRRLLSALVVCSAVLPVGASAQPPKGVPRIGLLQWEGCPGPNSVFGHALSHLGYTWGEKIETVCRSAEGSYRGLSKAADELVAQKVDVIVGLFRRLRRHDQARCLLR